MPMYRTRLEPPVRHRGHAPVEWEDGRVGTPQAAKKRSGGVPRGTLIGVVLVGRVTQLARRRGQDVSATKTKLWL